MRKDEITKRRNNDTRKDEITKRRNNATRKDEIMKRRNNDTRKDEITPNEKTKERQAKRQKDEITPHEKTKSATRKDDKLIVLNGVFSHGVFSSFRVGISTFRVAGVVISSFRVALFRLLHGVISSFRVASFRCFAWRYFGRKDEMAQTSHHRYSLLQKFSQANIIFFHQPTVSAIKL